MLDRLHDLLTYDPLSGAIRAKKTCRLLTPDEQGSITVYDGLNKRRIKMKAEVIAWSLGNNKDVPDGFKVLFRNLNSTDFRLQNLLLLKSVEFNKIQEAKRNLDGLLSLQPHPEDQYKYVVQFREAGIVRREVKHDIVAATQRFRELQLKFVKVITKYCLFG